MGRGEDYGSSWFSKCGRGSIANSAQRFVRLDRLSKEGCRGRHSSDGSRERTALGVAAERECRSESLSAWACSSLSCEHKPSQRANQHRQFLCIAEVISALFRTLSPQSVYFSGNLVCWWGLSSPQAQTAGLAEGYLHALIAVLAPLSQTTVGYFAPLSTSGIELLLWLVLKFSPIQGRPSFAETRTPFIPSAAIDRKPASIIINTKLGSLQVI